MKINIRFALKKDIAIILNMIQLLADFEKLAHEVSATEAQLENTLFGPIQYAEVLLLEENETAVGMALFFHNYSTFLAKPGIYLEDLFVLPASRGRGYGKLLLVHLAQIAFERNCGRLDWAVLDWNTDAIRFYQSLGAKALSDWTGFRISGSALVDLALTR